MQTEKKFESSGQGVLRAPVLIGSDLPDIERRKLIRKIAVAAVVVKIAVLTDATKNVSYAE